MKRFLLWFAAVLAMFICVLAIWIYWARSFPAALPMPTGPYAIGRAEFDWRDEDRQDPFHPNEKRELDVLVWYPAQRGGTVSTEYVRENWLRELGRPFPMPKLKRVTTHSWADVPAVVPTRGQLPVVILCTGFGAIPADYTSMAEELASRGFVVAAPANTYSGMTVVFPDGHSAAEMATLPSNDRLAQIWADDVATVVKKLTRLNEDSASTLYQKLELSRLGVIGHSFGGVAAAQYCIRERACVAGIDMDGALAGDALSSDLRVPFLFMVSDGSTSFMNSRQQKDEWNKLYRDYVGTLEKACARSANCRVEIERGFRHANFTDSAALFRAPLVWVHPALGSADRYDGLKKTERTVIEFLSKAGNLGGVAPAVAGQGR